jgi:hypothetical protein
MFTDAEARRRDPNYYPPVGTIGDVLKVDPSGGYKVQWPEGTTSGTGKWWVDIERVIKCTPSTRP